jgi:flagellar export protein FliJ
MIAFRFPLQKALDWRKAQLELEEIQFRRQTAAMADLDSASAQLNASGKTAERQVRDWNPVSAGELAALGSYRLHVKLKESELAAPRAECRQELDRRQSVMLEARRRLRLLERLRERHLAEWQRARDKELEDLASEAYLAKWHQP